MPQDHRDTVNNEREATAHSDVPTIITEPDDGTLVGKTVGNFQINAILGQGAFGNVYDAKDTTLGRRVALKFLRNPLNKSAQTLFEREARAIAALSSHPGIVDIYHWGEFGGQHYFVLQYVDSNTVRLLAENPDGIPVPVALKLFAQCAEALAAAHEQGILHRDIKPANILFDEVTKTAKVADFGLARFRETTDFTLNGLISGSPPYMSPEQARGEPLDARSDVFSLGVSMYEMLCGQRPFEGNTVEEILLKVRNNDRVAFRSRRDDIHEGICHIVEKATAYKPSERYQTATEFAQALRIALASMERSGAISRSPGGKAPRRNKKSAAPLAWSWKWAIPISGVLLLALGLVGVMLMLRGNAASDGNLQVPQVASDGATQAPQVASAATTQTPQVASAGTTPVPQAASAATTQTPQVASAGATPVPQSAHEAKTHVVKSGDTIANIAERYGLERKDLARWNLLTNPNSLQIGQTLYLYERPDLPAVKINWRAPGPIKGKVKRLLGRLR